MSSGTQSDAGRHDATGAVGSSTQQHVTGAAETGTFITDETPTGDTPAHGSSNAVFNDAGGNRVAGDQADQGDQGDTDR
jgi:hypothetical protein